MNCVNCGAAPRVNQSSCIYCESMLNQRVPEADIDGFHLMLRTLQITGADTYKVDIVERFRKKFTAGQVRQLLATFDTDTYRVDAAEWLIPRTTNPSGLLGCADLFDTDTYRCDFVDLLDDHGHGVEEAVAGPTVVAQRSSIVWWVLAALLLANLVWMATR
jgi:hypothetical protein